MDEKRRFRRVDLSTPVNYETSNSAKSKNLSEGGLCIITEKPLQYGHDITIMFSLPGESLSGIKTFGKVVWSRFANGNGYENGIQFWDMSPLYAKRIAGYIKKHPK